ncbi:MAG: PadR family transcriptional regulator [Armatimonadota bacterium]
MAFRSDVSAIVLGVLRQGPLHGYDISRRIQEAAGDTLALRDGQLYPILHRLEADGHVEAEWVAQEGKPARKVYRITESGGALLDGKRADFERFVASVHTLLDRPLGESHA